MNMYDTEVAEGLLQNQGMQILSSFDETAGTLPGIAYSPFPEADVILMNTCSIREHAEERVFGRLGLLKEAKRVQPELIIGLMGCMVEEHREKLFQKYPHLDLMVGTRNISELPALIEEVRKERKQVARIKQEGISIEYTDQIKRAGSYHAWLPVMTGCNKVCTFCIVPITRGSEVSMPAREVYREASRLVDDGVRWITLLGQNVNSYDGRKAEDGRRKEGQNPSAAGLHPSAAFPELLDTLCQIEGLERISFTTSHPSDATEELYRVIAKNPKISRRFHLPLQSGANPVLKRMKRLHTYEEFKQKIDSMRRWIPEISVTTDIIAGFCGETEQDHQDTLRALGELCFDDAYIYKYSTRPGTPASKLADDVPISIKEQRNRELLELQKTIRQRNNEQLLGETFEVFVEEISPKDPSQLRGRTQAEKTVVFPGPQSLLGSFQKVKFRALRHETFLGILEAEPAEKAHL